MADTKRAAGDTAIASTEHAAAEKAASAARLFDIRRVIGGLFTLYGVVVLVTGLVDGKQARERAAGIDINVWTGIGMLIVGLTFLIWMWARPAVAPEPVRARDEDRPTH